MPIKVNDPEVLTASATEDACFRKIRKDSELVDAVKFVTTRVEIGRQVQPWAAISCSLFPATFISTL